MLFPSFYTPRKLRLRAQLSDGRELTRLLLAPETLPETSFHLDFCILYLLILKKNVSGQVKKEIFKAYLWCLTCHKNFPVYKLFFLA